MNGEQVGTSKLVKLFKVFTAVALVLGLCPALAFADSERESTPATALPASPAPGACANNPAMAAAADEYVATFEADRGVNRVVWYDTMDDAKSGRASAFDKVIARDFSNGDIDDSGEGEIVFRVMTNAGYVPDSIVVKEGAYGSVEKSDGVWAEDGTYSEIFRITRIADNLAVDIKTAHVHSNGDGLGPWVIRHEAAEATCDTVGVEEFFECPVCNKRFSDVACTHEIDEAPIIAALEHDWRFEGFEWTVTNSKYTAEARYGCSRDSSHATTVEATVTGSTAVLATCTAAGKATCTAAVDAEASADSESHSATQEVIIPALGHAWDEGKVTLAPTATTEGVRTFTCKNDPSHVRTEAIPAMGSASDSGDSANAGASASPDDAAGQDGQDGQAAADGSDGRDGAGGEGRAAIAMHRLYNQWSGEHFYTGDDAEFDNLVVLGWTDEGTGWTAPATSDTPVYRLYNSYAGEHHYTMDPSERDGLVAVGWTDEGVGWYSDDDETTPLLREYNPNEYANNHNYTTDAEEHSYLVGIGWIDEGRAWYGL